MQRRPCRNKRESLPLPKHTLWIGNSVENSDVVGNSDVWSRDRSRDFACDREIQEHKHAAHMLQACGLGSSQPPSFGRGDGEADCSVWGLRVCRALENGPRLPHPGRPPDSLPTPRCPRWTTELSSKLNRSIYMYLYMHLFMCLDIYIYVYIYIYTLPHQGRLPYPCGLHEQLTLIISRLHGQLTGPRGQLYLIISKVNLP